MRKFFQMFVCLFICMGSIANLDRGINMHQHVQNRRLYLPNSLHTEPFDDAAASEAGSCLIRAFGI